MRCLGRGDGCIGGRGFNAAGSASLNTVEHGDEEPSGVMSASV